MGRDDWYRNSLWSPAVAEEFETKLRGARKRSQYLRIQANCLAQSEPHVALHLLDRYFQEDDQFDSAQAHADRASAFIVLGRVDEAMAAYDAALSREADFPGVQTRTFLELPLLVATEPVPARFEQAVEILNRSWNRLVFPVDFFMANASLALILDQSSPGSEVARAHAAESVSAAGQHSSGFQYHQGLGLVGEDHAELLLLLERIADSRHEG